ETPGGGDDDRQGSRNRRILFDLTDGLDVHWDGRHAPRWRIVNRAKNRPSNFAAVAGSNTSRTLDGEGLIVGPRDPNSLRAAAQLRFFVPAPRSVTDPTAPTSVLGLLLLDSQRFGVAQVDIDGAMHKAIMLADSLHDPDPAGNLAASVSPEPAPHPDVFDPG